MATACIPQVTFGFEPKGKPVVARFDQPHASSDGGAVLLKSLDTQLELTKRLAGCLVDARQPGKVQHQTLELVRQRVFGLACGYADCNDAARLADDAIHKLLLDRDPLAGRALASQPTLSRFENAVRWAALAGHGARAGRHRDRDSSGGGSRGGPRGSRSTSTRPTTPPTASRSSPSSTATTTLVLPAAGGDGDLQRRAAQYAVAAVLRPGNAPARRGARGLLRRLLAQAAGRLSRGDAARAAGWRLCHVPRCSTFLERQQVEYVVAMASNRRLEKRARRLMGKARDAVSKATGADRAPVRRDALRRPDVEAQAAGDHQGRGRAPSRARSEEQSAVRGDQPARRRRRRSTGSTVSGATWRTGSRNCITGWRWTGPVARASCANQFRVLLTLAAYILFQDLRRRAAGTACADAQVTTLRERLLKLAVWVERSVRRIVLHLPLTFPWLPTWQQLARAVGATP